MENFCASYIRQVGRELKLPRRRKRAPLNGLRLEMEEQFLEGVGPETLLAQMGGPAETARSLLEGVQPEEQRRYHAVRRRRAGCVIAALAVFLAASVGALLYLDANQVKRVEITITRDFAPVGYSDEGDHSAFAGTI